MALRRTIAGLIWAAILAVAVQLVPGTASAHDGRGHEGHRHASVAKSTLVKTTTAGVSRTAQGAVRAEVKATVQAVLSSTTQEQDTATAPSGNCTGGCCGNSTCGGAALSIDATIAHRAAPAPGHVVLHAIARSGLAPDELIRPPRSLA